MKSDKLNTQYKTYLEGNFDISSNEIHQIGFKLGKHLSLNEIHAVDWNEMVPGTMGMGHVFDKIKTSEKSHLIDTFYEDANRLNRLVEDINNNASVIEALRYVNSVKVIDEMSWLNHRLVTYNLVGEYIGNKWLQGWYVRNLNIVSNILDIADSDDRILVIYGYAHNKLLREMFNQNPEIELIDPLDYIGKLK